MRTGSPVGRKARGCWRLAAARVLDALTPWQALGSRRAASVYFSGGLRLEVSAIIDDVRDQMVGDASVIQLQTEHGRKVFRGIRLESLRAIPSPRDRLRVPSGR